MSTSSKENPVIILVIVLALVVLGLWIKDNASPVPITENIMTVPPVDITPEYIGTNPMSYAQALAKYKDARIQLDEKCQANPSYATYKNGTSVMIDNRSTSARTVKVGATYIIKAYGFKIVNLSSSILPVRWLVDCGKSQNVATIFIQK